MRLVISDAGILGGKPCFEGTRLAVQHVADMLETGLSDQEILDTYPDLSPEDVKTAHSYRFPAPTKEKP